MLRSGRLLVALGLGLAIACSGEEDSRRGPAAEAAAPRAETPRVSPAELLEQSAGLLASGRGVEALWELERGVELFPDRADLRLALGLTLLELGEVSLAEQVLREIPGEAAEHRPALLARARGRLRLGELEAGLELLREAEDRYYEATDALVLRALTLGRDGRLDAARLEVERVRPELEVEDPDRLLEVELVVQRVAVARGELEQATSGLRELAERRPDSARVWRALTRQLLLDGSGEAALALLDAALAEQPGERVALVPLRALVLMTLARDDEAEQALQGFAESAPSPSASLALARFHARRDAAAHAAELLGAAQERYPEASGLPHHRVDALISAAELDLARSELEALAVAAPNAPQTAYLRGRLALAEGSDAEAVRLLADATARREVSDTLIWLARALEAAGDYDEAERRYAQLLVRKPLDPVPYLGATELAMRRGAWEAATQTARLLARRHPARPEGCTRLVRALLRRGELREALEASNPCVQGFPDELAPRLAQARALGIARRSDLGLQILDAAEERFGPSAELDGERALLLARAGDTDRALTVLDAAQERDPESAFLEETRAFALFQSRRFDEAVASVDRALELDASGVDPLFDRCRYYVSIERYRDASDDCERYLRVRSADADAYFVLGVSYEQSTGRKAKKREKAVAAYRRSAALDPDSFAPRNNLAMILAKQGALDEALRLAHEAYALEPQNPAVVDTLGSLYLKKGLFNRAVSLLEEAHAALPNEPETQLNLARAYARVGRRNEARQQLVELRRKLANDPDAPRRLREAVDKLYAEFN